MLPALCVGRECLHGVGPMEEPAMKNLSSRKTLPISATFLAVLIGSAAGVFSPVMDTQPANAQSGRGTGWCTDHSGRNFRCGSRSRPTYRRRYRNTRPSYNPNAARHARARQLNRLGVSQPNTLAGLRRQLELFRQACSLRPHPVYCTNVRFAQALVYSKIGTGLYRQRRYREAAPYLRRAVQSCPFGVGTFTAYFRKSGIAMSFSSAPPFA